MSSIIKVDTIQDQDGNNIINENANTITIGKSGDTVTVAAGASFVGGGISWQSVQTTGFTAVAGNGYFCNTTSAGFTVTLPATPSAGDQIQLVDYAGTFDTNPLVINPNGNKIEGGTNNLQLGVEREGATLTYIDSTQGWLATSGINEGTDALAPVPYSIDFLVIAGGASGGRQNAGGGGAGGYRTSTQTVSAGTAITVTVGDGGALVSTQSSGNDGSNSSISGSGLTTITSTGGGGGGASPGATYPGKNGGSGGGAVYNATSAFGLGNTPSTSPSQGSDGGQGFSSGPSYGAGGGGGAGQVGGNATSTLAGNGGDGTASSITGSSVTRAGGGGGSSDIAIGPHGSGGAGGGGAGNKSSPATAGTVNTGSGGGGADAADSGAGGKGVVILAMPLANFSGTVTGSPTESDDGTTKRLVFNGSGSYTT
jgi:hypothetical protein